MKHLIDSILKLPYSPENVDKLIELVNNAIAVLEKNDINVRTNFTQLYNSLMKAENELVADFHRYRNTPDEFMIIASFIPFKIMAHHFFIKYFNPFIQSIKG